MLGKTTNGFSALTHKDGGMQGSNLHPFSKP